METRAVDLRQEQFDVYIGRPGPGAPWEWGNPFPVTAKRTREEAVNMFKEWLLYGSHSDKSINATEQRRQWILDNLHTLKGKRLGCFCKPRPCHGDVLAKFAELQ